MGWADPARPEAETPGKGVPPDDRLPAGLAGVDREAGDQSVLIERRVINGAQDEVGVPGQLRV